MTIAEPSERPGAPNYAPHFFSNIAWSLLPGVSYGDICRLCCVVDETRRSTFDPLIDALRRMQWAQVAAAEAIQIEATIAASIDTAETGNLIVDPIGQVRHAKALIDFISQSKSALDGMSVFLNEFLELGANGGDRDVKWSNFRSKVQTASTAIGEALGAMTDWLDPRSGLTESIIWCRDEWLHRSSPFLVLYQPLTEYGCLPIPREPMATHLKSDFDLPDYWRCQAFFDFHWGRLTELLEVILRESLRREAAGREFPTVDEVGMVSLMPTHLVIGTIVSAIRMGPFTRSALAVSTPPETHESQS